MSTYAKADTLMGAALAPLDSVRSAGLVIVFSLFIAACAQFSIHIGPIPITGQTFAVLLTGMLLGSRLGAAAVIAYLIEGAIGLPFFAGGGAGLVRFLGPTAGYLVAFPAAFPIRSTRTTKTASCCKRWPVQSSPTLKALWPNRLNGASART